MISHNHAPSRPDSGHGYKGIYSDVLFKILSICILAFFVIFYLKAEAKLFNTELPAEQQLTTTKNQDRKIDVVLNEDRKDVSIEIITHPAIGEVKVDENNYILYTPEADYCDSSTPDVFIYELCGQNGCEQYNIEIKVLCDNLIFFTGVALATPPNGKGQNFTIEGIERYPDNKLSVFNQFGNEVYTARNYKNEWDGTKEGKSLKEGTYYYVFSDGLGTSYSGYINIELPTDSE